MVLAFMRHRVDFYELFSKSPASTLIRIVNMFYPFMRKKLH